MSGTQGRLNFVRGLYVSAFVFLVLSLFYMQIIRGSEYKELSDKKISVNLTEKAPRGKIYDRYGRLLAGNETAYGLTLIKTDISDNELNSIILKILNLLRDSGTELADGFPIDAESFEFTFQSDEERDAWFSNYGHGKHINKSMTGYQTFTAVCKEIYNISSEYSDHDMRRIAGIRYMAEKSGFSVQNPFLLAENVPVSVISKIKESSEYFSCIAITSTYSRSYYNEGLASHVLGRVGKIDDEEYKRYKNSGYRFNDSIGKQGIEKLAEEYLRGTDGIKSAEGGNTVLVSDKLSVPGNNVVLTIDMDMQRVLEQSLEKIIKKISLEGGEKTGIDANSGAAVVIDVKNGDILACCSYPTYDPATFRQDYKTLAADINLPMWNRAVSGTYSPGSTFKPLVALAALESGNIEPAEKIKDEGIYTFYEDYQPRCWLWSENRLTHGSINVSTAIEHSCNCFFYEAGRRTGIDTINEFGSKFGLGEHTGTGLPEEVKGYIANPENKAKITNTHWYGADTLQAAIGQSVHSFTPVQIANYIATIANGGTRYKLNIIKSIRSGEDGSLVKEITPRVEEKIELDPDNLNAVLYGMKNVVEEGSARGIFAGYPVEIGGKTGTAQVGTKVSNNALFAAFAPFDKPDIAVCVVIEHGVKGANAAYVAKDLFDYYFKLSDEAEENFNEISNLD